MGLFMSENEDPEVYRDENEPVEYNQNSFKQEEMIDMIQRQQKESDTLQSSVRNLERVFAKQNGAQLRKLANARYHIEALYDLQKEQETSFGGTSESIQKLDEKIAALTHQIEQQVAVQKSLKHQLHQQESFQKEVLERLANQEVLTEKVLRKLDHFRSILYERTHFIGEKINKGYEATTAYFAKILGQESVEEEQEEVKEKSIS